MWKTENAEKCDFDQRYVCKAQVWLLFVNHGDIDKVKKNGKNILFF